MKKKSVLATALTAAMLGCTLFGGASTVLAEAEAEETATEVKSEEEFTLKVIYTNEESDGFSVLERLYKEMYPNATIEGIAAPWGNGGADTREKELVMLQSGEIPDVGKMIWTKEFAKEGLLVDITDFVESQPVFENLTDGQKDRMMYDGKYYSMTFSNNCVYMIYNKDILEAAGSSEPPATMDEVTALADAILEKGLTTEDGRPIYLTNFEGGNFATDYWVWANGGELMNEDYSETLINSPESIEAYQFMQDLVKNGSAPKIDGTGNQLFVNGQCAFLITGEWDLPAIDDAGINYGVATAPVGTSGTNTVPIGGAEYAVFEGSEHVEEALDWIALYNSEEFQKETGYITDMSLYDDPEFQEVWKNDADVSQRLEAKLVQRDQLQNTKYDFLEAPFIYQDSKNIYADALERILVGLEDVETTMNNAAQQINDGIAAELAG